MPDSTTQQHNDNDKMLRLVAFVFSLITTVFVGWTLLPLAWMLPMTIISYGIYKGTKKNTVAFGVCMLLFVNIVSGVLLLVAKKDDE
jgi:hypothetical protein